MRDDVIARIAAAAARSRGGDTAGARDDLAALWAELGPDGDPFHRMTLAHFAADVAEDLAGELAWDLRALELAEQVSEARVREYQPSMRRAGLLPSLYLSVADDYARLRDPAAARRYLDAARQRLDALPDDDYGALVRTAAEELTTRLGAG